jgi:thymidylate synthase (FAD)
MDVYFLILGVNSMEVKLIGFSPNPEKIPALAAKLTHSKTKPNELEKTDDSEFHAILDHVMNLGHTSVIEHTSFTFAISDVSRSLTHQLVRHRIASYAQQSQRYVNLSNPSYVTPPKINKNPQMKKAYDKTMKVIWEQYNKLMEMKIPAEDARYVLPNSTCTNIIVTMNARSLQNFFELRCCLHAQWEIRKLANKMLNLVKDIAPTIFNEAGPPCKNKNYCPEHNKKCKWYPKK